MADGAPAFEIKFTEARRSKARARGAVFGPSGCGKTLTGLIIARTWQEQIDPDKPFAVIDSEHGSADLYAPQFTNPDGSKQFRSYGLNAPYAPEHYIQAIKAAERLGAQVCLLDSISHEWMGEGGVQAIVDEAQARMGGNKWGAWAVATPLHNRFVETVLGCDMHVILTMRAKTEWIQIEGKPKKVGLGPVQREGIEYEFQVVLQQDLDHSVDVVKSRLGTILPVGMHVELDEGTTASMAVAYWNWLQEGEDSPEPDPEPEPEPEAGADQNGGATITPATKGRITKAMNALQEKHGDVVVGADGSLEDGATDWEKRLVGKLPELPWNERKVAEIAELTEAEAEKLLASIATTDQILTDKKVERDKARADAGTLV